MKSCKADLEMLGGRRQVNAKGLLREVHAAEGGTLGSSRVSLIEKDIKTCRA